MSNPWLVNVSRLLISNMLFTAGFISGWICLGGVWGSFCTPPNLHLHVFQSSFCRLAVLVVELGEGKERKSGCVFQKLHCLVPVFAPEKMVYILLIPRFYTHPGGSLRRKQNKPQFFPAGECSNEVQASPGDFCVIRSSGNFSCFVILARFDSIPGQAPEQLPPRQTKKKYYAVWLKELAQ